MLPNFSFSNNSKCSHLFVINIIVYLALNLLKSVRPDNNDDIGSDIEANDDDKSQVSGDFQFYI